MAVGGAELAEASAPDHREADASGLGGSGPPRVEHLGRYALVRRLATGGMGEVFLARALDGHDEPVVVKRILRHHRDRADYLEMFFAEARIAARLDHPGIVRILEMGDVDGEHFIAMEYVRGRSLRDLVDTAKAEARVIPVSLAVDVVARLADALEHAHAARDEGGRPLNIVHRDVNPQNVLLSFDGAVKLIDFGIAKADLLSAPTGGGIIKGKFVYMSPEQSAADPLDGRSDIFSLGIVLHEALTLENPFVRNNVVLSLEAIQRHPVAPPSAVRAEASPLDPVLERALAKDPGDRYPSAGAFAAALRRAWPEPVAPARVGEHLARVFAADLAQEARRSPRSRPDPLWEPTERGEELDPTIAAPVPADLLAVAPAADLFAAAHSASSSSPASRGSASSRLEMLAFGLVLLLTTAAGFFGARLVAGASADTTVSGPSGGTSDVSARTGR